MQIKYSYIGVPTLEDFSNSDAFIRGVQGPFGSGKSSACVVEIINRAREQKPGPDGIRRTRFAVVRNTYSELRDTTMKTVEQWLPERHFGRLYVTDHRYVINRFPNTEIEILFRALDKPADVKHLLSLELTGAWVNEAREVPWAIIEGLQGRVGRYPSMREGGPTWSGVWMDTNPPDSDSKWYRFFIERQWEKDFLKARAAGDLPADMQPDDYAAFFQQPGGLSDQAENLPNLSGGRRYYVNLSMGKTREWIKVYVDGDFGFVVEGKLIYPAYYDQIHCKPVDPVPGRTIIRSWDFGLTPACAFSQILPDGRWLVFDELVSESMGIERFSQEVLDHCARTFRGPVEFEDWADPAGNERAQTDERTCFEIMQAKGINVEAAFSQNPALRQEAVRLPMGRLHEEGAEFVMNPRCKVLRKGFQGGYHRRRLSVSGPERYSDKPEKNRFSHIHDALQYAMVQYYGPALTQAPQDDDFPDGGPQDDPDFVDPTRSTVVGY